MKPGRKLVIAAVAAGLLLSLASHRNGLQNLSFHLGARNDRNVRGEIEETLNQFNRNFATFFNTGGSTEILNEFPASPLIKRRIFQEIGQWTKENAVLVYDKDLFELETAELMRPDAAVAVAREVWFVTLQNAESRKAIGEMKANPLRVRYLLKRSGRRWQVETYEVFGEKEEMPPLPVERR